MHSMKEYALLYQQKGFSVIPISPTTKRPLIEFADKPPLDSDGIEKVWNKYPDANIALRTTNFFVIDIDKHGETSGFDSLKKWEHLKLIEPTLQAKTASGGKHLFYFKRDDINISQMIGFLPGVDIKAHENNYVLVAPSATSKGQYEWDLEKSPKNGTMVTASRELIEAIIKQYQVTNGRSFDYGDGLRSWANQSRTTGKTKTTELFETIANGLGDEGNRNDKLAKFVGGLLYRNVDEMDVLSLAKIANGNTQNPLSIHELEKTVRSMISKDRR